MANGVPCEICAWTETAHDMAVKYKKKKWYRQCLHKYRPQSGKRLKRHILKTP
jgi:hypothetical protein